MAQPEWKTWLVGSLAGCTEEADYQAILRTVPTTPNPTRLSDFGYEYNEAGELRHVETGKPFAWLGQKHYDALGDVIITHVQDLMKAEGLIEAFIPAEGPHRCNIFHTPDALSNPDKLMLLIQGSGAVRAGQWARALCINATLDQGTILPYLRRARHEGYGVIVFNPNFNSVLEPLPPPENFDGPLQYWLGTPDAEWKKLQQRREAHATSIPGSSSPEEHTVTVWDLFGAKAPAKHVVIVAHSYGGINTIALLCQREKEVESRLKAIALTDALQKSKFFATPLPVQRIMARTSLNWVASKNPLDHPEPSKFNYKRVSAGHDTHEYTSYACMESLFKWLEHKLEH